MAGPDGRQRYVLVSAAILGLYVVVAIVLATGKDFSDVGPLSFKQPVLTKPLLGDLTLAEVPDHCFPPDAPSEYDYKVVGGNVSGRPYYACYQITRTDGAVFSAAVIDARSGIKVKDVGLIKRGGAWPWIGLVKSSGELVLGGFGLATMLGLFLLYYRRVRPGQPADAPPWGSSGALVTIATVIPLIGWLIVWALRKVSSARKLRAIFMSVLILCGIAIGTLLINALDTGDTWGTTVMAVLAAAFVFGLAGGRAWVAPPGFGAPEGTVMEETAPRAPETLRTGTPNAVSGPDPGSATSAPLFRVQEPGSLPSFKDVGGMTKLKAELKETFGMMLAFSGEAETYRITWNGVLLHGPPGVGKTFLAKAVAGEFGLNFLHIATGDLVSAYRGESARNVKLAFAAAARHVPCILFFDEFDSVAQRRDDWPDQESRRLVNQLLQSLEEYRKVSELIVMAATNDIGNLDEAAIRPGRFDRHIRVDLPDADARGAIFAAQLKDRPAVDDLDLTELARRSDGCTPAAIAQAVEAAALQAFRQAAESGEVVQITMDHLVVGLEARGGQDRPTVEEWTWDKLILPEATKRELMQLQLVVEDPDRARAFGVEPPTGVLLTGPPGTGKTTVAKVLAAQAKCSFYPVTAATITSMWLGESEKNIARLFQRARENRPSIIFLDEIDALAGKRGEYGTYDREVNQLLSEIDGMGGQRGILVIAATNRPDQLDPALLRGGRLSRTIEIPLPDEPARVELFGLYTAKMPLIGVDVAALGRQTPGMSGADIKALCQQAALQAMMRRSGDATKGQAAVTPEDFAKAIAAHEQEKAAGAKSGQYL